MAVFFTADLHLQHNKVAEIRGFKDSEEHDKALVEMWQGTVTPNDQIWVLGDVALGDTRNAMTTLRSLHGRKYLVTGNHDKCHPLMRGGHLKQWQYLIAFDTVNMAASLPAFGSSMLLSHFPYAGDTGGRGYDRYTEWRLRDNGLPLIHGHTHSSEKFSLSPNGSPQVHVGLDAWERSLVKFHSVLNLFEQHRESKQPESDCAA